MEFLTFLDWIPAFFKDNTLVAIGASIILILMIYKRPRLVLTVFLMGLLVTGVFYMVMSMSTAGVEKKKKLIERSIPPELEMPLNSPGM